MVGVDVPDEFVQEWVRHDAGGDAGVVLEFIDLLDDFAAVAVDADHVHFGGHGLHDLAGLEFQEFLDAVVPIDVVAQLRDQWECVCEDQCMVSLDTVLDQPGRFFVGEQPECCLLAELGVILKK